MWDKLFSNADLLQRGLSAAWDRNAVIRHNIANAETPGFKGSNLEFESIFAQAIEDSAADFTFKQTRSKHFDLSRSIDPGKVRPTLVTQEQTAMRMDGNNVDAEAESVKLAQNSLWYNTLMEKLNSDLTRLTMAIREGK